MLAFTVGTAAARDMTVSAGEVPPQIGADGAGREASIIRETLAACGHRAVFRVVPFGRHWREFQADPALDAVATVPDRMSLGGTPTGVYVEYQNGASYLAGRIPDPVRLADLEGRNVVGFAGADAILPGVKALESRFASYRELAEQRLHSMMLYSGRVDVVLADGLIVAEYDRRLQDEARAGTELGFDPEQPVRFSGSLFPPTPYHLEFHDAALARAFDGCFRRLETEGRIAEINRSAVEPYRAMLGRQYLGY